MKFSSEIFNGDSNKFLVKLDFIEIDTNLNSYETNWFSINYVIDDEIDDMIFSMIINQINQNIYKNITKKLFDCVKFDHINIGNSLNIQDSQRLIVNKIIENKNDYSSMISSGMLCSELMDTSLFSVNSVGSVSQSSGILYSTGKLSGINVYCDPYMGYNDGRICLFDKVKVNIKDFELSYTPSPSFAGATKIKYDLSIDVGDSMLIFVLGDSFDTKKFLQLQRDIKIDNVLNGL